ncbi:MAG: hypothetical protein ABG776_06975, partial [Cyanobacteria bacterium J06555_13]
MGGLRVGNRRGNWQADLKASALAAAVEIEGAVGRFNAIAHTLKTKARLGKLRIETLTIVFYVKGSNGGRLRQLHMSMTGVGMPNNVSEGGLNNAVKDNVELSR